MPVLYCIFATSFYTGCCIKVFLGCFHSVTVISKYPSLRFRRSEKTEEMSPTEETMECDTEKPPKRKQVRFHSQAQFRQIVSLDDLSDDLGDLTPGSSSLSELRNITAEPVVGPPVRLRATAAAAVEPVIGPPVRMRSNSLTEPVLAAAAGRAKPIGGQTVSAAQKFSALADPRAKTTVSKK
jgi:hypothetical protein